MRTWYQKGQCWIDCKKVTLPMTIKGFTMRLDDGTYLILINDRLTDETTAKTHEHELKHIAEGHFDLEAKASQIEALMNRDDFNSKTA